MSGHIFCTWKFLDIYSSLGKEASSVLVTHRGASLSPTEEPRGSDHVYLSVNTSTKICLSLKVRTLNLTLKWSQKCTLRYSVWTLLVEKLESLNKLLWEWGKLEATGGGPSEIYWQPRRDGEKDGIICKSLRRYIIIDAVPEENDENWECVRSNRK